MGTQQSVEDSQAHHHHGERGTWLKFGDLFENRVPPLLEERQLREYYRCYVETCGSTTDSAEFTHNEEHQALIDNLEEDVQQKVSELGELAARHLHDIVGACVHVIDDCSDASQHEGLRFVETLPGVGTAYVRGGFFFFHWTNFAGEKLGRLEVRVLRRLAELHQSALHLPLSFHIVHKGEAVTVQALCPISPTTRIEHDAASPELHALTKEILDCFNLKPYEVSGVVVPVPPDVELHCGFDGRYYSICNFQWLPPWPRPRASRFDIPQRFACFRPELLASQPLTMICRAFHSTAFITDNTVALQLARLLINQFIHDIPKIVGTIDDRDPATILIHFRRCGFNWHLLGLLLLSLLRNVSPPRESVDVVITEMFARGIKQFIASQVAGVPIVDAEERREEEEAEAEAVRSRGRSRQPRRGARDRRRRPAASEPARPSAALQRGSSGASSIFEGARHAMHGASRDSGYSDSGGWGGSSSGSSSNINGGIDEAAGGTVTLLVRSVSGKGEAPASTSGAPRTRSRPHFLSLVEAVLMALLEYGGAPVPRPATMFEAGVPAPTDLFGGEVIPMVYRKFMLLPSEADLYKALPQEQKLAIYNRACELLGIMVRGGRVSSVLPLVVGPTIPSPGVPLWVEKRLEALGKKLFVGAPLRSLWVQQGPATIVLLRHQPSLWAFYAHVRQFMETLQPPNFLWHAMQSSMERALLNEVVDLRQAALADAPAGDRLILLNLMRKQAFAAFDDHCFIEAGSIMDEVHDMALALLAEFGNTFAPQYRRCCSEAVAYLRENDGDEEADRIEAVMLRNVARYCQPDTLVGKDYLQAGTAQAQRGHHLAALENLNKAKRTLANSAVDTTDTKMTLLHRCEANIAAVLLRIGNRAEAVNIVRRLLQQRTALPDVLLGAAELLDDTAPAEVLDALESFVSASQQEKDSAPFLFIPHMPLYR